MSYQIPKFRHPELPVNELGYTKADYEGSISTLCAGCGHDSITSAITQAFFELDIPPHLRRNVRLELYEAGQAIEQEFTPADQRVFISRPLLLLLKRNHITLSLSR